VSCVQISLKRDMRFERGKRRRTKARGEERESCKRVGLGLDLGWTWVGLGLDLGWTWVEPDWTKRTEVRGVAALDISVFGRSGLKLNSLAT
jgi:hypothetical protein